MSASAENKFHHDNSDFHFSWRDACPWFIIFRAISIACSPTIIFFAVIGVTLSAIGWFAGEAWLIDDPLRNSQPGLAEQLQVNGSSYQHIFPQDDVSRPVLTVLGYDLQGIERVYLHLTRPAAQLLRMELGWRLFVYYLTGWLWMIAVWSFAGTAICRVAVLQLTRSELIGIGEAFRYAVWKAKSAFGAVILPVVGVIVLGIPLVLAGLLLKFAIGAVVVGVLWCLCLLIGFLIALLLFGLLISWPLMVPSVATEGQDAFDAISRTFAYSLRRPLHYLFYGVVALLIGGIVWFFIGQFSGGVIHATHWAASFGSDIGDDRMVELIPSDSIDGRADQPSPLLVFSRSAIRFWNSAVWTVAAAFIHGFFWVAASALYLLLRKDMDLIDISDVFQVEHPEAEELPPLEIDDGQPVDLPDSAAAHSAGPQAGGEEAANQKTGRPASDAEPT